MKLAMAMRRFRRFAAERGVTKISLIDFSNWCDQNDKEAGVELDKMAAKVFNKALWGGDTAWRH